jgi:hypothetical protein
MKMKNPRTNESGIKSETLLKTLEIRTKPAKPPNLTASEVKRALN